MIDRIKYNALLKSKNSETENISPSRALVTSSIKSKRQSVVDFPGRDILMRYQEIFCREVEG